MNKNIDFKINDRTVVHISKEEDAIKLCRLLDKLGAIWWDGSKYTENNRWHVFNYKTSYNIQRGTYTSVNSSIKEGYEFIPAEEFIKLHELPDPAKHIRNPKIHILEDGYLSSLEERCNNWIDENNYEVQNIAFSAYPNGVSLYFYATITYVD